MYSLKNNPLLLPHQRSILASFFASPLSQTFFLTGGTALAAFYFAHRDSKDFDFFSIEQFSMPQIGELLKAIAEELGASVSEKITTNTYKELYMTHPKNQWVQRIDIVREQPKHFGQIQDIDGVRVDSLENIGSNKVLTLFGRLEPKDYVDFYTIITRSPLTFEALWELAKQKDAGLTEFYFTSSIANVDQMTSWPTMKMPFDHTAMITYYQNLSRELLLRIKPRE